MLAFLTDHFPRISPDEWLLRLRQGAVQDSAGCQLAPDAPYRALQHLHYRRAPVNEPEVPFEALVLYEDERIVVADKPHFLPVTPGGAYLSNTLQNRLRRQLGCPQLQAAHRLDRETAGLVLLVKSPEHRKLYQALFAQQQVFKRYLAIAPLAAESFVFPLRHESRLEASGQFFLQQEIVGTPNSLTEIALRQSLPGARGLYELIPHTGKKHQLRVHMAAIGCPIEGDRFYPVAQAQNLTDYSNPLQLLAQELRFMDPISGASKAFYTQRVLDGIKLP